LNPCGHTHTKLFIMQALKNNVQLIGNLGQDVQIVNFESGSKKANVTLATSDYYKNKDGEMVKQTQWHRLVAWGPKAELMAKLLQKGSKVAISGSIEYKNFTDKSGAERFMTEIKVSDFLKFNKISSSEQQPAEMETAEHPF
jgi:single-strand DNA-binding protein